MKRHATRTRQADSDLIEIGSYIAARSPAGWRRLLDEFDAKGRLLADFPELGRQDTDRPGRRFFVVREYLIVYRPGDDGIEVLRYVHGRRDLQKLL